MEDITAANVPYYGFTAYSDHNFQDVPSNAFYRAAVYWAAQTAFRDVSENAYYVPAVSWAVEQRIAHGTSTTTFSPDSICTRAQIVTFMFRYAS